MKSQGGSRFAPEHDFGKFTDAHEWELVVFDNAMKFTTTLWIGPGRYDVREFANLPDALKDATDRVGSHGRVPFVRAVCATGRFTTLDRKDWSKWRTRWERKHVT